MFRSLSVLTACLLSALAWGQNAASTAAGAPTAVAPPVEAVAVVPAPGDDFKSIDQEVQSLKKEVLDLNRELFVLEEELLFPANTQVAVFVSMDVGEFFALDSVTLKVDNKEVANYLYTEREAQALLKGGVHRVYIGNLKAGEHELIALVHGAGAECARLSSRRNNQAREGRRRQVPRIEDQRPGRQGAAGIHRQGMGVTMRAGGWRLGAGGGNERARSFRRSGFLPRITRSQLESFLKGVAALSSSSLQPPAPSQAASAALCALTLVSAPLLASEATPEKTLVGTPQVVKDLHWGDVLFYFYQDDYLQSLTRLGAAQDFNRVGNHALEAELLKGGLYLSLGQHEEAGRIFKSLLNDNVPLDVRNRAWFYLAKVWYQRNYLEDAATALSFDSRRAARSARTRAPSSRGAGAHVPRSL